METKAGLNALKTLYELGQSPWYDNIDRRLIITGELERIVKNGITGLTSNPTIFEKAVAASDIYGEQIGALAKKGKSAKEIYDEVTISDVRDAADLLRDVYIRTDRVDGYVSIEVYPEYAHDTGNTISYAKAIFERIGRDNIMIKIPGTKEGFEAVRALIKEGINVNVTLLFSLEQYENAAGAYIEGLKSRVRDGEIIDKVVSVASVFVSRIDTRIDKMLDNLKEDSLKGRAAVAHAKMIYQRFKELFGKGDFDSLKKRGAHMQRPLWASTSTKNPLYSDVKYVEELIGEDTINTIPHSTMDAFLGHGSPHLTIEEESNGAKDLLKRLNDLNIDINQVCQRIQDEGVDAFQRSFDKLIDTIEKEIDK